MNHLSLVGRLHGQSQGPHQLACLPGLDGRAVQLAVETAAWTELEREEGRALVLAHLEDLDDVGVLQASDGERFRAEASQVILPGMSAMQDHLQSTQAVEPYLVGLVDHAHASSPEFAKDFVARHAWHA